MPAKRKDMSWLNEGSGGAIVKPPQQGKRRVKSEESPLDAEAPSLDVASNEPAPFRDRFRDLVHEAADTSRNPNSWSAVSRRQLTNGLLDQFERNPHYFLNDVADDIQKEEAVLANISNPKWTGWYPDQTQEEKDKITNVSSRNVEQFRGVHDKIADAVYDHWGIRPDEFNWRAVRDMVKEARQEIGIRKERQTITPMLHDYLVEFAENRGVKDAEKLVQEFFIYLGDNSPTAFISYFLNSVLRGTKHNKSLPSFLIGQKALGIKIPNVKELVEKQESYKRGGKEHSRRVCRDDGKRVPCPPRERNEQTERAVRRSDPTHEKPQHEELQHEARNAPHRSDYREIAERIKQEANKKGSSKLGMDGLRKIAQELGIKRTTGLRKAQLIDAITTTIIGKGEQSPWNSAQGRLERIKLAEEGTGITFKDRIINGMLALDVQKMDRETEYRDFFEEMNKAKEGNEDAKASIRMRREIILEKLMGKIQGEKYNQDQINHVLQGLADAGYGRVKPEELDAFLIEGGLRTQPEPQQPTEPEVARKPRNMRTRETAPDPKVQKAKDEARYMEKIKNVPYEERVQEIAQLEQAGQSPFLQQVVDGLVQNEVFRTQVADRVGINVANYEKAIQEQSNNPPGKAPPWTNEVIDAFKIALFDVIESIPDEGLMQEDERAELPIAIGQVLEKLAGSDKRAGFLRADELPRLVRENKPQGAAGVQLETGSFINPDVAKKRKGMYRKFIPVSPFAARMFLYSPNKTLPKKQSIPSSFFAARMKSLRGTDSKNWFAVKGQLLYNRFLYSPEDSIEKTEANVNQKMYNVKGPADWHPSFPAPGRQPPLADTDEIQPEEAPMENTPQPRWQREQERHWVFDYDRDYLTPPEPVTEEVSIPVAVEEPIAEPVEEAVQPKQPQLSRFEETVDRDAPLVRAAVSAKYGNRPKYIKAADEAAWDIADNFSDEIVEMAARGEISDDLFSDYPNGDGYHHENFVDRAYSLQEASEILSQHYDNRETDNGLWHGLEPEDAISAQAAYTFGNAVSYAFNRFVEDLNERLDNLDNQSSEFRSAWTWAYLQLLGSSWPDDIRPMVLGAAEQLVEEGSLDGLLVLSDWIKEHKQDSKRTQAFADEIVIRVREALASDEDNEEGGEGKSLPSFLSGKKSITPKPPSFKQKVKEVESSMGIKAIEPDDPEPSPTGDSGEQEYKPYVYEPDPPPEPEEDALSYGFDSRAVWDMFNKQDWEPLHDYLIEAAQRAKFGDADRFARGSIRQLKERWTAAPQLISQWQRYFRRKALEPIPQPEETGEQEPIVEEPIASFRQQPKPIKIDPEIHGPHVDSLIEGFLYADEPPWNATARPQHARDIQRIRESFDEGNVPELLDAVGNMQSVLEDDIGPHVPNHARLSKNAAIIINSMFDSVGFKDEDWSTMYTMANEDAWEPLADYLQEFASTLGVEIPLEEMQLFLKAMSGWEYRESRNSDVMLKRNILLLLSRSMKRAR